MAGTNVAANWTNSLGNFSIPINTGVFTSNGLKTVEIYATDDAGSVGNKVTLSFTLNVAGISPPTAPVTPTLQLITTTPGFTNDLARPSSPVSTSTNATVELFLVMGTTPTPFSPPLITTADAIGNFIFTFPDMTGGMNGTFARITVVAQATQFGRTEWFQHAAHDVHDHRRNAGRAGQLRLAPDPSDTGIHGRRCHERPNAQALSARPSRTRPSSCSRWAVPPSTRPSPPTASGDFSIQLPFILTNGSISLYVEADRPGRQPIRRQQHAHRDDRLGRVRL